MAVAQEIDKELLVGQWKFVKATVDSEKKEIQYNRNALLTFEQNGHWRTEDFQPFNRHRGSWKIENENLIRDPDKTETADLPPYSRRIEKLTQAELVISAIYGEGRDVTFYFKRK